MVLAKFGAVQPPLQRLQPVGQCIVPEACELEQAGDAVQGVERSLMRGTEGLLSCDKSLVVILQGSAVVLYVLVCFGQVVLCGGTLGSAKASRGCLVQDDLLDGIVMPLPPLH